MALLARTAHRAPPTSDLRPRTSHLSQPLPKFPEPPPVPELSKLPADEATLPDGTLLWRIYLQAGKYPTTWDSFRDFGPTNSRFDHHLEPKGKQSRAILYASQRGPTCFAEVFQETRTIDRHKGEPWLVGFELARSVRLLDLTGNWPTQAGASMAINSGPRPRARCWSQAMYQAYPAIEGILYCSSMDGNRPAVALYERARSALPAHPVFHRALADSAMTTLVTNAALQFGYLVL